MGRMGIWFWGRGLDSYGSKQGPVESSCGHGTEPSDSIECGEIADQINVYVLMRCKFQTFVLYETSLLCLEKFRY